MADVGHAGADEGLVDLGAGDLAEELGVVRVVRAADDGLLDLVEVDLDHGGVLGVLVGLQQLWVGQPGLDRGDAALQGTSVVVAVGDHVLHQHHIALQVLDDRVLVELDGAAGGRALGAGIGQLEGLFDLQVRQTLDLQDAAGEDVLFAGLGDGQQSGLDGIERDGVHQVTQGDARLHLALEANQDGFGHVQGHDAGGRGEGDQA